jgi:hypothetical protein
MASANTPGLPRPSFLGLPAEVRVRIYRYVFGDSQIRLHIDFHTSSEYDLGELLRLFNSDRSRLRSLLTDRFSTALIQVCCSVHQGALVISQESTKLIICSPASADPAKERLSLWPIPSGIVRHVRVVEADWDLVIFPTKSCHSYRLLESFESSYICLGQTLPPSGSSRASSRSRRKTSWLHCSKDSQMVTSQLMFRSTTTGPCRRPEISASAVAPTLHTSPKKSPS